MEFLIDTNGALHVRLSRRNLLALLAKLDGHPPNSNCTLVKVNDDGSKVLIVKAEEDAEHYKGKGRWPERTPGRMHDETEKVLAT